MKKIAAALLALFSVVSLLGGCTVVVNDEPCGIENVYLLTNAEKYEKYAHIGSTPETVMTAALAKNEGEGMQFVYKPEKAQTNVRVTVSDFVLDGGTEKIEDVTVYYQHYIYCAAAYTEYKTLQRVGYYPDILIPINGDCSDLNGIDVEANANQGFWITVWSAKDQTAGVYRGEVTLETDGGEKRVIPVEITVWDFSVPEEPSFDAAYSIYWFESSVSYKEAYEYALRYRLNGSFTPSVRSQDYDADTMAKKTAEYLAEHPGVSCFMPSGYTAEYFNALEKYGILDKCFTYYFDEPGNYYSINKKMSETFAWAHALNPNVKNMVTTASRDTITDVDIWCGIWSSHDCDEPTVRDRISEGYEMWWYGCVGPKSPYPTYHIQDDLMTSRLVHWMQKDWGFTGNLYWVTDMNKRCEIGYGKTEYGSMDRDIYTQPYVFHNSETGDDCVGAAGDGFLFCYAKEGDGVVNRNMILPTIRLESVRDGSEDFEYLTLLEKKMTALFEKWGVTEVTVDEYMDTYYDSLYNSMADFDRDPKYMIKMRERVAHDILNAECAIDVEAAPTYENVNRRTVAVYAEKGSDVVVDGKTVAGESRGAYSVYTATFDMNTLADRTEITVLVNGKEYTRVLKSVEESELMEEARLAVQSDAEELGLSVSSKDVRIAYENNTFEPNAFPELGSLDAQLSQNGSVLSAKRLISKNREYGAQTAKRIAADITNTIPLAVMNTPTDLIGSPTSETLTLYVPNGAEVKVNGEKATFVSSEEKHDVYAAVIDVGNDSRHFYDVEVTLNGVTQTWKKVVLHQIVETTELLNINASDLAAKLAAVSRNKDSIYEVIEYNGAPAIKFTVDGTHDLTIPSSVLQIANLTDYSGIIVDVVGVSENTAGFDVTVLASMGSKKLDFPIIGKDFDGLLPESFGDGFRRNKITRLLFSAGSDSMYGYPDGGTYIIKGIYAMKDVDDIAKK